jgi:hypothetical protein
MCTSAAAATIFKAKLEKNLLFYIHALGYFRE